LRRKSIYGDAPRCLRCNGNILLLFLVLGKHTVRVMRSGNEENCAQSQDHRTSSPSMLRAICLLSSLPLPFASPIYAPYTSSGARILSDTTFFFTAEPTFTTLNVYIKKVTSQTYLDRRCRAGRTRTTLSRGGPAAPQFLPAIPSLATLPQGAFCPFLPHQLPECTDGQLYPQCWMVFSLAAIIQTLKLLRGGEHLEMRRALSASVRAMSSIELSMRSSWKRAATSRETCELGGTRTLPERCPHFLPPWSWSSIWMAAAPCGQVRSGGLAARVRVTHRLCEELGELHDGGQTTVSFAWCESSRR
jgi:hypothetical protein